MMSHKAVEAKKEAAKARETAKRAAAATLDVASSTTLAATNNAPKPATSTPLKKQGLKTPSNPFLASATTRPEEIPFVVVCEGCHSRQSYRQEKTAKYVTIEPWVDFYISKKFKCAACSEETYHIPLEDSKEYIRYNSLYARARCHKLT
jgi:hypothetical protein